MESIIAQESEPEAGFYYHSALFNVKPHFLLRYILGRTEEDTVALNTRKASLRIISAELRRAAN